MLFAIGMKLNSFYQCKLHSLHLSRHGLQFLQNRLAFVRCVFARRLIHGKIHWTVLILLFINTGQLAIYWGSAIHRGQSILRRQQIWLILRNIVHTYLVPPTFLLSYRILFHTSILNFSRLRLFFLLLQLDNLQFSTKIIEAREVTAIADCK